MAVIKSKKDRTKYESVDENGKRIPRLKDPWKNQYCKWKTPDYTQRCNSSNRDDIFDYIVRTHLVEYYTSKLMKQNADKDEECREYIQEMYLLIAEVKQDKWDNLYAQGGEAVITAFVSGIIIKNVISNSSRIYKKIRGYRKNRICFPKEILDTIDEDGNFKLKQKPEYEE